MVIAVDLIERWLQPTPDTTDGDATLVFDGDGVAAARVLVAATAAFAAVGLTAAVCVGGAGFTAVGVVAQSPAMLGSAAVAFDGDVEAVSAAVTRGSADVIIDGVAQTAVSGIIEAAFGAITPGDVRVVVDADAGIDFADYGGGSAPVLPFKLPVSFTDNLLNVQDAAARVQVSGSGFGVTAAVVGSAELDFDSGVGSTFPVSFPFEFGTATMLRGLTPIFNYLFPAVFNDPANEQVGDAVADVSGPGEVVVSVVAAASADVSASPIVYRRAIFPFVLPASFASGELVGEAVVVVAQSEASFPLFLPFTFGSNVEVVVYSSALADFHVPGIVGRGVFPYSLPTVF